MHTSSIIVAIVVVLGWITMGGIASYLMIYDATNEVDSNDPYES